MRWAQATGYQGLLGVILKVPPTFASMMIREVLNLCAPSATPSTPRAFCYPVRGKPSLHGSEGRAEERIAKSSSEKQWGSGWRRLKCSFASLSMLTLEDKRNGPPTG